MNPPTSAQAQLVKKAEELIHDWNTFDQRASFVEDVKEIAQAFLSQNKEIEELKRRLEVAVETLERINRETRYQESQFPQRMAQEALKSIHSPSKHE